MAETTKEEALREIAEMGARNPEIGRLILAVCDLYDEHGSEGVDLLLDLNALRREQLIDERRASFRVIDGRA